MEEPRNERAGIDTPARRVLADRSAAAVGEAIKELELMRHRRHGAARRMRRAAGGRSTMKRPTEPKRGTADTPIYEITLESVQREYEDEFDWEVFEVEFHCASPPGRATATVAVIADEVSTLEIVPAAMSELHKLFANLSEQTKAWLIVKPQE